VPFSLSFPYSDLPIEVDGFQLVQPCTSAHNKNNTRMAAAILSEQNSDKNGNIRTIPKAGHHRRVRKSINSFNELEMEGEETDEASDAEDVTYITSGDEPLSSSDLSDSDIKISNAEVCVSDLIMIFLYTNGVFQQLADSLPMKTLEERKRKHQNGKRRSTRQRVAVGHAPLAASVSAAGSTASLSDGPLESARV
jgi:hypothetical protein